MIETGAYGERMAGYLHLAEPQSMRRQHLPAGPTPAISAISRYSALYAFL
jgi:hypothetical protein